MYVSVYFPSSLSSFSLFCVHGVEAAAGWRRTRWPWKEMLQHREREVVEM